MFTVKLEQFHGPLDLLLQLIEQQDLDISDVSLASVTEPYLDDVQQLDESQTHEIAEFLVVAARLVWIKSKGLLPAREQEEEMDSLEDQLRLYQQFVQAARLLEERYANENKTHFRRTPPLTGEFVPPKHISPGVLEQIMQQIVHQHEKRKKVITKMRVHKTISLEESIARIRAALSAGKRLRFGELFTKKHDRGHRIVHFLALLELVKQRHINLKQQTRFEEIHITTAKV